MSTTANVQKAYLQIESAGGGSTQLACWFNPTSFTQRRGATWKQEPTITQGAQNPAYLGGEGDTISLNLLLHVDDDRTGTQLAANIKQLLALVEATITPNANKPAQMRPPTMTMHWGSFVTDEMIAKSVDVTYELFDVDGTPLRATVTLALAQYQPGPGQGTAGPTNPTTRATQARRAHRVQPGDTVHLIAHHHLRDPTRWRAIAESNHLEDPLRIRAGDVLVIPTEDV